MNSEDILRKAEADAQHHYRNARWWAGVKLTLATVAVASAIVIAAKKLSD